MARGSVSRHVLHDNDSVIERFQQLNAATIVPRASP